MTPEELIEAGIAVIERDGWHQGDMYEGGGTFYSPSDFRAWRVKQQKLGRTAPVCALGSIYRAAYGTAYCSDLVLTDDMRKLLLSAQRLMADAMGNRVAEFNDTPGTTREDVLLAMKKAAHHG